MDGPTFPTLGYPLAGATPVGIPTPASRPAAEDAPKSDAAQTSPQEQQNQAAASSQARVAPPPPPPVSPAFVVEFSKGLSGGYVLACLDPETKAVLVQVPMRSAFTQIEGAATPEHIGKTVDTTV